MAELRYSRLREGILEYVRSSGAHPTADEVYAALKGQYPTLGLATVYRNLNLLVSEGMLARLATANGGDRFESRTTNHGHMICSSCGAVQDMDIPLTNMEGWMEKSYGFRVSHHHWVMYGTCKECQK
ncbi:MAG: transcriptional repressor [Christensenellaceae bacterium]|nr:transcriptional repressor [Christensenellaceae bacterium]